MTINLYTYSSDGFDEGPHAERAYGAMIPDTVDLTEEGHLLCAVW